MPVLGERAIVLGASMGGLLAARVLAGGDMLYLYHPQVLIAHSDRLEGYTQMPDGLVRVVGLKLK